MRHYSILVLLSLALSGCSCRGGSTDSVAITRPGGEVEMNISGTSEAPTCLGRRSFGDGDPDSFLKEPPPPQSVKVDGTITEENGEYDTYGVDPSGDPSWYVAPPDN